MANLITELKRMFTSKEMKKITAKNYKKLPEVQQKLIDNREKQLKVANRLLADIFNKVYHSVYILCLRFSMIFLFTEVTRKYLER